MFGWFEGVQGFVTVIGATSYRCLDSACVWTRPRTDEISMVTQHLPSHLAHTINNSTVSLRHQRSFLKYMHTNTETHCVHTWIWNKASVMQHSRDVSLQNRNYLLFLLHQKLLSSLLDSHSCTTRLFLENNSLFVRNMLNGNTQGKWGKHNRTVLTTCSNNMEPKASENRCYKRTKCWWLMWRRFISSLNE